MIRLIPVPYHLGRQGVGMGNGPGHILSAGAVRVIGSPGHQVVVEEVEVRAVTDGNFPFVIGATAAACSVSWPASGLVTALALSGSTPTAMPTDPTPRAAGFLTVCPSLC